MPLRPIPQAAIDLIKSLEALRLTAYQDSVGVWTIGYGHTDGVLPGETITEAQADAFLIEDLQIAASRLAGVVSDAVILALTDNQYSALLSFVFNLGANPSWQIWAVLNARQFDQVPVQLIRFTYAGGKKLQGLVNRRTAEIRVWSTDEPGSEPVGVSSSVTRATVTPAVPLDPKPKGMSLVVATAVPAVAAGVANIQGAAQAVSNAVTPYESGSVMFVHLAAAASTVAGGCAIGLLIFKWYHDRQAKSWTPKPITIPLLPKPQPEKPVMTDLTPPTPTTRVGTVANAGVPGPGLAGAGTPTATAKPFDFLADLEATAKRLAVKLGVEVQDFETAVDLRGRLATLGAFLKKVEAGL